jgi:hypothetical protein
MTFSLFSPQRRKGRDVFYALFLCAFAVQILVLSSRLMSNAFAECVSAPTEM